MYNRLQAERESVAYFMRRLYAKDLTTCSGGNISLRLPDDMVLITPSALDKGELQADQVAVMRMDGENLTPHLPLTIEWEMHLEVLRNRPDAAAVVHAHPPYATAFACMERPLDICISSEIYLLLDGIATAPYAPPGTPELARVVGKSMVGASVSLMANHGVITVGKTLLKAFDLMEVIENTAKMNFVAQAFGGARPLSAEEKRVTNAAHNRSVDF